MDITLLVHVERVPGEQAFAWWAESDELPGFSAAGDSMQELREVAMAAIAAEFPDVERVRERLAGGTVVLSGLAAPVRGDTEPDTVGRPVRSELVFA
jgi:predicted RNase H-like HicB family nuclease